jgi:oxygen-independent coproporphyrinogen-3 oxidase
MSLLKIAVCSANKVSKEVSPMRSFTTERALEKAHGLSQFDAIGLRRTLHGYYYAPHYPPLRAMKMLTVEKAEELFRQTDPAGGFEVYVHFPFCEVICSFCHFFKELGGSQEREVELLDAIKEEIALYATMRGPIIAKSLQIGGGTPSLMSNQELVGLLGTIDKHSMFADNAERKIELFPKRYAPAELREKLTILRDYGFTDLVIDLESGNAESLKAIGRRISSLQAYLELVEECIRAGFTSIVTALMMGLPFETFESVEATVGALLKVPEVKIVNTFPTIIREPDPIFAQCQRHPDWFPDAGRRDAMWLAAREMLQAGFEEGPLNFWHLPSKLSAQQSHKLAGANLLGFGPSAFGYWSGRDWGLEYFNHCTFSDYFTAIEHNELPIWKGGLLQGEELARRHIIQGLANCGDVDLVTLGSDLGLSVDELFGRTLNALLDVGLIQLSIGKRGIRYTELGRCRHEEIAYFLASEDINKKVRTPIARAERYRDVLLRHNFYPVVDAGDVARFTTFVNDYPSDFMNKLATS